MKLAIVVGHSAKEPSFKNYLGETEYDFNRRIASKLKEFLDNNFVCDSKVFLRDGTTIRRLGDYVTEWKPDASIELHCNSYKDKITGNVCEALALRNDFKSIDLCRTFGCLMELDFTFGLRHGDGCKEVTRDDRGYFNLTAIELDIPKILVEPCFTNFHTEEAEALLTQEDRYAKVLAATFVSTFNIQKIHKEDINEDFIKAMRSIRNSCDIFIKKWENK